MLSDNTAMRNPFAAGDKTLYSRQEVRDAIEESYSAVMESRDEVVENIEDQKIVPLFQASIQAALDLYRHTLRVCLELEGEK